MQPSPGWCINIDRRYLSNERMIENVFEYKFVYTQEAGEHLITAEENRLLH